MSPAFVAAIDDVILMNQTLQTNFGLLGSKSHYSFSPLI